MSASQLSRTGARRTTDSLNVAVEAMAIAAGVAMAIEEVQLACACQRGQVADDAR